MLNHRFINKVDMKAPSLWIGTWFGCGLMNKAPGTWGTLGGLPFGVAILAFFGWAGLLLASVVIFVVGYRASLAIEDMADEHDHKAIVIDEVAGIWISLIPALVTPFYIVLAFILFRFFDILKPWPVSWCDKKLMGPLGVMADDVMAGIYTAAIIGGLRYAGFG